MSAGKPPARTILLAGALALGGCATFSADGGMQPVARFAHTDLGKKATALRSAADDEAARRSVAGLLKKSLTADAAVQIALLNNRGLQAAYNALGLAETAMVAESLPPNPTISLSRLSGGGEIEIERRIAANILALATLPTRAEIAADRFRQAQLRAAAETMRLAAETRRAYYDAVAAAETAVFLAQAQTAASSAATLARRLGETGAMNKLDQAREQVFYADITTQVATARRNADAARERLIRALGLWGDDLNFRLASRLPALPARAAAMPTVEREAIRRRLDLQTARLDIDALAKRYGLSQAMRFVNLLEVAGHSKTTREGGDSLRANGFEVEFQIPVFDFGEVRTREAEETYRMAVNRLTAGAIEARSEARAAYRAYRAAYDIARHYEREVLPLRQIISDETLLRYNAMQIDVFDLLAEARQRIAANTAAIAARRDFLRATVDLHTAIAGAGSTGEAASPAPVAISGGEVGNH